MGALGAVMVSSVLLVGCSADDEPNDARPSPTSSTAEAATATLTTMQGAYGTRFGTLERTEDRTVAGEDAFVLEARDDVSHLYVVGVTAGDIAYTFTFEVPLENYVEPILASVEWP